MKKSIFIAIAAIALIACKPNGQDPSFNPTSAKITAFKIMEIPTEGYRYTIDVQNDQMEAVASTEAIALTSGNLPKTVYLNKFVDVTKKAYKAAMWKQEKAGSMPAPVIEYGELYTLPALKAIGYPGELEVYHSLDRGAVIKAIYVYEE